MNPEACPKLYECSKVKMTPMIRVLLRCTAAEAMQSICADCEEWDGKSERQAETSSGGDKEYVYTSPSGGKLMVMVADDREGKTGK